MSTALSAGELFHGVPESFEAGIDLPIPETTIDAEFPAVFVHDRLGGRMEQQIGINITRVTLPDHAYERDNALSGSATYTCAHWITKICSGIFM
jgi:hypothetical protein